MINVEDLGIVLQRPHYRIKRINVQVFGPWSPMYQLEVKIKGHWVFIVREHIILDTDEGRYSALLRLKEKADRFNSKLGFYKVYGWHNHPLEEFTFTDGGGFEGFTRIVSYDGRRWLWTFGGNHKRCSAAFTYWIWDRKLAGEIRRKLKGGANESEPEI